MEWSEWGSNFVKGPKGGPKVTKVTKGGGSKSVGAKTFSWDPKGASLNSFFFNRPTSEGGAKIHHRLEMTFSITVDKNSRCL